MCPGLVLEKHVLSSEQLSAHASTVYAWPPADIYTALLSGGVQATLANPITAKEETFTSLVCFGSQDVSFAPHSLLRSLREASKVADPYSEAL